MKELKDYPGYFITESGDVYNDEGLQRPVYLTGIPAYKYVNLPDSRSESGWQVKRVHILVAQTYVPNPDDLPMVDHEDRDKMNCHHSNLRWVTSTQNNQNKDSNLTSGGLRQWMRDNCPTEPDKMYHRMRRYHLKNQSADFQDVYIAVK